MLDPVNTTKEKKKDGLSFSGFNERRKKNKKEGKKKRLWKQNQWLTLRNHQYVC